MFHQKSAQLFLLVLALLVLTACEPETTPPPPPIPTPTPTPPPSLFVSDDPVEVVCLTGTNRLSVGGIEVTITVEGTTAVVEYGGTQISTGVGEDIDVGGVHFRYVYWQQEGGEACFDRGWSDRH